MLQRDRTEAMLTVVVLFMLIQSGIATKAYAEMPTTLAQATQSQRQPDAAPAPPAATQPAAATIQPQSSETPSQSSEKPSSDTNAAAPTPPADQGDPNVTPQRQAFDRVLVDAAVLRNQYEESKRSGGKLKVSLSAFRSLEIRLKEFVDADPSNTQARDMMNAMQQAQGEILGPSIAVAAAASRQLYSDELGQRLAARGYAVSTRGRAMTTLLIVGSDKMTSAVALDLDRNEKIFDRAKMLQFENVLFRGKRGGKFDVGQDRFANAGTEKDGVGVDKDSADSNVGTSSSRSPDARVSRRRAYGRRAIRLPNLYGFIRRVF